MESLKLLICSMEQSGVEKLTNEMKEEALQEFEGRVKCLSDENAKLFKEGILKKMLQNIKNNQKQSAKKQLSKASAEYDELVQKTQQYQNKERGYQEIHGKQNRNDEYGREETENKQPDGRDKQYQNYGARDRRVDGRGLEINDISKQASYQLRKNNPNIADLSDSNRPTKVAERYSELYDNEWTEAFEELSNLTTEVITIKLLLEVVTSAYQFCKERADLQIKQMCAAAKDILKKGNAEPNYDQKSLVEVSDADRTILVQFRKQIAESSLEKLKEEFSKSAHEIVKKFKLPTPSGRKAFDVYVKKCVELTWWMCVQDPPVTMSGFEGVQSAPGRQPFDTSSYRAYTKSGRNIDYLVWPCIRLHENGPVLCKGVAQGV